MDVEGAKEKMDVFTNWQERKFHMLLVERSRRFFVHFVGDVNLSVGRLCAAKRPGKKVR